MTASQSMEGGLWLLATAVLYALPVLIGAVRDITDLRRVALLCLAGGWTGLLWLVAFGIAVRGPRPHAGLQGRVPRDDAAWAAVGVATAPVPAPHPSWSGWS